MDQTNANPAENNQSTNNPTSTVNDRDVVMDQTKANSAEKNPSTNNPTSKANAPNVVMDQTNAHPAENNQSTNSPTLTVNVPKVVTDQTNATPAENNPSTDNPTLNDIVHSTRTVKVSNVSLSATEKDIQDFFSICGDLQYVDIQRETETTHLAYVTFKESQGAETAVLLTGATIWSISNLTVSITLAENYQLPPNAVMLNTETPEASKTEAVVKKAEDVVSTMLSKGYSLGKDALDKAKVFDEKHSLTTSASATVSLVDSKLGLKEKLSIGTAVVNEKVKEMDERYQVREKTRNAFLAAEEKATVAGSAIMSNPYVSSGASWVTHAFHRVVKAAGDVSQKTKEKLEKAEEEKREIKQKEQIAMVTDYARIHLAESPAGEGSADPFKTADGRKTVTQ